MYPKHDKIKDMLKKTFKSKQEIADSLSQKLLSRFRNPSSAISFNVDINNVAFASTFIKPTDIKNLTTDEAFEKGDATWVQEQIMIFGALKNGDSEAEQEKGAVAIQSK